MFVTFAVEGICVYNGVLCVVGSERESSWLAIVQDINQCDDSTLGVGARVSLLEKALSYSARSAARPTRPKR